MSDWCTIAIPKDGSCLFRAVSMALYGAQVHHTALRRRTVRFLHANRAHFAPFVAHSVSDFDAYLAALARDGAWAGEVELAALGAALAPLRTAVRVRSVSAEPHVLGEHTATRSISLLYTNDNHYDVLVTARRARALAVCQSLAQHLVQRAVARATGHRAPSSAWSEYCDGAQHTYRNIEWEAWRARESAQEARDAALAAALVRQHDATDDDWPALVTSTMAKSETKANQAMVSVWDRRAAHAVAPLSTQRSSTTDQKEPLPVADESIVHSLFVPQFVDDKSDERDQQPSDDASQMQLTAQTTMLDLRWRDVALYYRALLAKASSAARPPVVQQGLPPSAVVVQQGQPAQHTVTIAKPVQHVASAPTRHTIRARGPPLTQSAPLLVQVSGAPSRGQVLTHGSNTARQQHHQQQDQQQTINALLDACKCHRRRRADAPTQVLRDHTRHCPARTLLPKCSNCGKRHMLMARCTVLVCAYCRQHGHVEATCKRRRRHQRRQETELFDQGAAQESRD